MIPVSVVITVRNEEQRLQACLKALRGFSDIIVVDSRSHDRSADIARQCGARLVEFIWNGAYPKKRQWCLENVPLKFDWVLFIDADEIMTGALEKEILNLFTAGPVCAGYFIKGCYLSRGKKLRFGRPNFKLCLLDRRRMKFPVVDDISIPGMGEIEGHYQPVKIYPKDTIGTLKHHLLHDALDDRAAWNFRHEKYARWEAGMNILGTWPEDPGQWRQRCKAFLRKTRWKPELIFLTDYILMLGFLDGRAGLELAFKKYRYYQLIRRLEGQLGLQSKR